jgi:conjugative transfer region protein TrbK
MFRTVTDILIKLAAFGFLLVCILVAAMKAQLAPVDIIPGVSTQPHPPKVVIPARCRTLTDESELDIECLIAWRANLDRFLGVPDPKATKP